MALPEYTLRRRLIEPRKLVPAIVLALGVVLLILLLSFFTPLVNYPLVLTCIMLGAMGIVMALFVRYAIYTINEEGISEELRPWFKVLPGGKPSKRQYLWSQVTAYQSDTFTGRYGVVVYYIEVILNDGYLIKIMQKEGDDPEFLAFRTMLLQLIVK